MATAVSGDGEGAPKNLEAFEANLKAIEALSARLVAAMSHRRPVPPALQGPGQELYLKAASAWMAEAAANPRIVDQNMHLAIARDSGIRGCLQFVLEGNIGAYAIDIGVGLLQARYRSLQRRLLDIAEHDPHPCL